MSREERAVRALEDRADVRVDPGHVSRSDHCVIDSQCVNSSTNVPLDTQGIDAANYQGLDVMPGRVDQGWLVVGAAGELTS